MLIITLIPVFIDLAVTVSIYTVYISTFFALDLVISNSLNNTKFGCKDVTGTENIQMTNSEWRRKQRVLEKMHTYTTYS